MPTVVSTETSAHRPRTPLMTSSPQRRRATPSPAGARAPPVASVVATLRARPVERGLEVRLCLLRLLVRQRHELRRLGERVRVLDHVAHEPADRRIRHRLVFHVDEERSRERLVLAALDGLRARRDAAATGIHRERLQRVLVLLVVREAEVAEAALLAPDPL